MRSLLVLLALSGCKNVGKCKDGTLLVSVSLPAGIADADQLQISVSVDQGAPKVSTVAHATQASGTIEVDFSPYPAGHPIVVEVTASRLGVAIGSQAASLSLRAGCDTVALMLIPAGADLAGIDAPAGNDGPVVTPTCSNGMKDTGETDIDCGGPCPPCITGKSCSVNGDCQSNICNLSKMICAAGDCSDGVRDDAESDIDCGGGTCPACTTGQACLAARDCANMLCNLTKMLCVASSCDDGVLDGTETNLDCGGGCPNKCKQGQSCLSTADCASPGACDATHHCVAAQCTNSVKDAANPSATPPIAAETDVDCGGTVCAACPLTKMCLTAGDCLSGFCNAMTKICVADQCHDGVKDGSESDIDCGGSCAKCNNGMMCSGPSDCGSAGAICDGAHQCCVPSCSGKVCGSDGCGGSCGSCTSSTQPMCNAGGTACVCTASSCTGGLSCNGTSCTCPTGTSESCFDGIDNNCDGLVDCADPQCSGVGVCVPAAPGGFSYGTIAAHGNCPGGTTPIALIQSVSSPSSCTGCGSCTAYGKCSWGVATGGGVSCTPVISGGTAVFVGTVSADTINANGNGCVQNITMQDQTLITPTWSGSCTAGTPSKPTLTINYEDYCVYTGNVGGGCGGGSVCTPVSYRCVESNSGTCTGSAGPTLYNNIDDSGRGCTACSACTMTAGTCTGSGSSGVDFALATDCSGGGDGYGSSSGTTANVCFGGNVFHSFHAYMFNAGTPTCGSGGSSSTVTGSAVPTSAVSICCN